MKKKQQGEASIKQEEAFIIEVSTLIDEFHQKLKAAGYNAKLSKLTFAPSSDEFLHCPCGTEWVQDPVTGKVKLQCKRCVRRR